jgi:chitinase
VTKLAPGSCNQPCPGNPTEICGGRISRAMRIIERQISLTDALLILYANPAIINASASSDSLLASPSSSTPVSSTVYPSNSSIVNLTATSMPSEANSSTTATQTTILTGKTVIYPHNLRLWLISSSAVYIDICPTGYTTITTSLTTSHCDCTLPGATAIQTAIIPMTTIEKLCTVCAEPGYNSPKTVTLTVPDTSAIVAANISPKTSAIAGTPAESLTPFPPPAATEPCVSGAAQAPAVPGAGSAAAAPSSQPLAPSQPIIPSVPSTPSSSSLDDNAVGPGSNNAGTTEARRVTLISIPMESSIYAGTAPAIYIPLKAGLGVLAIAALVAFEVQ